MPTSEFEKLLLDIFLNWRGLIKLRSAARPGTPERKRLDDIFCELLPVIARISEAPTNLGIAVAKKLLDQVPFMGRDDE